ncbi:MAG TPA: CBS domain-containing protein [Spongiibacteraceae bacterium]|nr:CBS domain-containing protein [Spongiibacteraceae bacterium]
MSIGDFCKRAVATANREMDAVEAAQLMRAQHVNYLVIVAESNGGTVPLGVITDRDLVLEVLAQQVDPRSVALGDIMTAAVQTARVGSDSLEALLLMANKGVHHLIIVSGNGQIEGVITIDNLIEMIFEQLQALQKIVRLAHPLERNKRSQNLKPVRGKYATPPTGSNQFSPGGTHSGTRTDN